MAGASYRVVRVLSRTGDTCRVELWERKKDHRLYAAKLFVRPSAEDSARIVTEAELMKRLSHPFIMS